MQINEYYVYVILDTRYNENSKYCNFSFKNRPIYIGKGKQNRKDFHLFKSMLDSKGGNMLKKNTLNKIIREGYEPIVQILKDNLTEHESFELEQSLIGSIGCQYRKTGTLTNLTNGGEGQSGSILFMNENNPFYGKKHNTITRIKLSKPINKLSISGDIIRTYPSAVYASKELEISNDKIRDCLKGRLKTYKGYRWEYVNKSHRQDTQISNKTKFKYISQKDLNGEEVKRWETISTIVKTLKTHKSNLIDCLKGRKNTCIGYRWEYII